MSYIYYEDTTKVLGELPEEFEKAANSWKPNGDIDLLEWGTLTDPWVAIDGEYWQMYLGGTWEGYWEYLRNFWGFDALGEGEIGRKLEKIAEAVEDGEMSPSQAREKFKELAKMTKDEDTKLLLENLSINEVGRFSAPIAWLVDGETGELEQIAYIGEEAEREREKALKELSRS